MPEGAVYVDWPTKWANPFVIGGTYMWLTGEAELTWPIPTFRDPGEYEHGIRVVRLEDWTTAMEWFRRWATTCTTSPQSGYQREALAELAGCDLACWCPLDQPCHADVLLDLANGGAA